MSLKLQLAGNFAHLIFMASQDKILIPRTFPAKRPKIIPVLSGLIKWLKISFSKVMFVLTSLS